MALQNKWVGYLDRSHQQIKNSILKRLGETNPEITDHSESNILVVIVSIFSGVTEMINYYIDNMAREAFISTARRYSSVVKHTRLIDYRIKAALPASADLNIIFYNELNEPTNIQSTFDILQGTRFYTNSNISFITTEDYKVNAGDSAINIAVEQKTYIEDRVIGTTVATIEAVYGLGIDYVHNSLLLKIGGQIWNLVDSLGRSGPDDENYVVEITADRKAVIKFGDGINGKIPNAGMEILASYYITQGELGNVNSLTIDQSEFIFDMSSIGAKSYKIRNITQSVGGTDYESIERIRRSAPLSLRTLDRAVTRQDYIDITMLSPGVDKATVHFDCGKYVELYISPNGGGIASSILLQNTKEYINTRKMITTEINVKPAGETYIVLDIEVWAKFRMDTIQTKEDIIQELLKRYNYEASDVNRSIRKSDLISAIDNLEKVDYLNLKSIYLKPYFRKVSGTSEIISDIEITHRSTTKAKWLLQYDGNFIRVYKDNNFDGNITIGTTYTDQAESIKIKVQPNNYQIGDEWNFTTYPYTENIEVDDFTVPVIDIASSTITVNKQIMK